MLQTNDKQKQPASFSQNVLSKCQTTNRAQQEYAPQQAPTKNENFRTDNTSS